MPDPVRPATSKVLSDHRRDCETERDYRQEERLHDPRADAESRLSRRTEISNDEIDDQDVEKEQDELCARGHADAQHRAPDFYLRLEELKSETQVAIFFLEVPDDEQIGDKNGNESRECRASYAQLRPGSDPEN